jgi:hypothetical protein
VLQWPALRELDEASIEEVTRPVIDALRAIPQEVGPEKGDGRDDRLQARRRPSMTTDNILTCEHRDSLLAISQVPITSPNKSAISTS